MTMLHKTHEFKTSLVWTGNRGTGTSSYRAYGREHDLSSPGKSAAIAASSSPVFRGNADRYNPEELVVAALSSCHMLAFLHLCADAGITVTAYTDDAEGTLAMNADGSGQFTGAVLHPRVTIEQHERYGELEHLHERTHEMCFIARSVNFPVRCEAAS